MGRRCGECHVLADQPPQHGGGISHRHVEVEHPWGEHLAAAESEQLASELGGAPCRVADLSDVPAHLRVGAHLTLEQAAEAEDRGEQVVEVVSDAACQLADGLHLLGLAQLLLEAKPFGDVLGEHEPGAPAFELDPVRENFHVDEGPVLLPVLGVAHRRRATVLSGQRRFESGDLAGRPDVGQSHP